MKKLILLFIIVMLTDSCDIQNRIDLESLTFKEKSIDLLKSLSTNDEPREINTTLPVKYTQDIGNFKFGDINLIKSKEKDLTYNKVGLLFEKPNNSKIVGITINIENKEQSIEILNYLKSKNGNPKIIAPIPTENKNGQLLGYSAYLWKTTNNKFIVLSQSYGYINGKRDISSLIYIVKNNVKVTDPPSQELVVDRLMRTYKL